MSEYVRLGDIGEIITGNTPKTSDENNYSSNDICFVKPSDLSDNDITEINKTDFYISEYAREKARILPVDSVLVSCIGIIGKVGITKKECAFNQQINAIIPNLSICMAKYLAYLIQFQKKKIQAIANAPVVPILNKTQFSDITILVPNLTEQQYVIGRIDAVTALIDKHKKQLEKLDELVKARFVEMFGDVGIKKHREETLTLKKCCIVNPKKTNDDRLHSGLEVSFIPMPCVSENGDIDASQIKEYDEVKTGFTYFSENDVLFAKITPCMENGKGAIARGLKNGIGFGSTEFHVLRPTNGLTNPYWLYVLTTFKQFRKDAESNMTGSAGQRRVPVSFIENYRVYLPPIELQDLFANFVKQVEKTKTEVQKSLEQAETLKKALMQKYFG